MDTEGGVIPPPLKEMKWHFSDEELPLLSAEPYIIKSKPVLVNKPKANPPGTHFGFCVLIIEPNHIILPQRMYAITRAFDCKFYDFAKIATRTKVHRFLIVLENFKYLHLYDDYDIVSGKLKFTNGDNYGQGRP